MSIFPAPPLRTEFPKSVTPKFFSWAWEKWFSAIAVRFNAAPIVITGSRANPATIAALFAALADAGIIVDNTTP